MKIYVYDLKYLKSDCEIIIRHYIEAEDEDAAYKIVMEKDIDLRQNNPFFMGAASTMPAYIGFRSFFDLP